MDIPESITATATDIGSRLDEGGVELITQHDGTLVILDEPSTEGATSSRSRSTRAGGVVGVFVFFEVSGRGSFTANIFDTAKGTKKALLKPGLPITLRARPATGQVFDGWFLNGNFSSESVSHRVNASRGLVIQARFVPGPPPSDEENARTATRRSASVEWSLSGSDSFDLVDVPEGSTQVTFINNKGSAESVRCRIDGFFVGGCSPDDNLTRSCAGKRQVGVELETSGGAEGSYDFS